MAETTAFRLPRLCLPRPGTDMTRWAVIACDQYTSQPAYWDAVAARVGDAPSTLHLIFPEVYLGAPDACARIERIGAAMRSYLAQGLLDEHSGPILVERTIGARTRRGLMLELDLDHYDFSATSTSLIRPTEDTIVARLAPRIAVRRDAELELPHVLVLIDDPRGTVIEPVAAERSALRTLYDFELMMGGGRVAGHALGAPQAAGIVSGLAALADPAAFAARYGVGADVPPMLFAVGDGNHSLATAKSIWEGVRGTVAADHPSRHALVEVVNIHDPALDFAPIHRLLFGVRVDVRAKLAERFGSGFACTDVASAAAMRERVRAAGGERHAAGLIGPGARFAVIEIDDPSSSLAVGTLQPFVDRLIADGGAADVDYVHGDEALERLAQREGHVGIHLATVGKADLLRQVVREGPLPRKAFSMGEADEKRFYVEARRIR